VEDNAGQLVPAFPWVEPGQNTAAIGFVVDHWGTCAAGS
jgi:hypothetical protein